MSIPTIYLAAPWKDRDKAREVRDQFVAAGIECTSRWLDTHFGSDEAGTDEQKAIEAMHDVEDVLRADILVLWNSMKSEGKAVETGLALATAKGIVLIGERTNVFHYLRIPRCATVEEAIEIVRNYPWRPGQEPSAPEPLVPDPAASIILAEK
jgi:nucleoside 2-deoxyribosyltransferase